MRGAPLVHLVDPHGPGASRWLHALATRHAEGAPIIALGSRPVAGAVLRVPVAAGDRGLAARALERALDEIEPVAVMAWGVRAIDVAVRARDAARRWLVMDAVPAVRSVPFDAEIACLSDAVADRASAAGWPPMRMRVLRAPVPVMAEPDDDGARRRAWRESQGVAADAFVVGLLPSEAGSGDALATLHAVGRVRMVGLDARLVLQPDAGHAGAMQAFARSIGLRSAVHFIEGPVACDAIAPAVDAWVSLPGPGVDGTALDPMVAAGLLSPLVAQRGSLAAASIDDGVDGVLADPPNGFAAALLRLAREPARRRELAMAARVRHAAGPVRQAFAAFVAEVASSPARAAKPAAASA